MALEIVQIHEAGKEDSEYISLRAVTDCDLKYSLICDTTYTSETTISNKLRHMYWFAPKAIKKGDYVFLYTGDGTNTSFTNKANTTTYVFYWGLDEPIWNDTGDCGVLFDVTGWSTARA